MNTRPQPVFSPSQTKDFLRDPGMWYFRHVEKWRPKMIGKKEVAGILGSAIADGAAVFHNGLKAFGATLRLREHNKERLIKDAAATAVQTVKDEKAKVKLIGQTVYDDQSEAWELLEKRAAEGVFKLALYNTFQPEDILDVELTLPDHGFCRIDLVVQTLLGPMVVDLKTSLSLDAKYVPLRLREYEEDWQFYHYAWAYQDYLTTRFLESSEEAKHLGPGDAPQVRRFGILLLVLEPKSRLPRLHPIAINPELMALWHHSATQVWRLMDAMRKGEPITIDPRPWSTFNFYSKFGREDWADAFTKYFLDPGLLPAAYVKEPR
jgi:hypothetical protein